MIYRTLYVTSSVTEAMRHGLNVMCLDKESQTVFSCNEMSAGTFYELMQDAEEDTADRYFFYTQVKEDYYEE